MNTAGPLDRPKRPVMPDDRLLRLSCAVRRFAATLRRRALLRSVFIRFPDTLRRLFGDALRVLAIALRPLPDRCFLPHEVLRSLSPVRTPWHPRATDAPEGHFRSITLRVAWNPSVRNRVK